MKERLKSLLRGRRVGAAGRPALQSSSQSRSGLRSYAWIGYLLAVLGLLAAGAFRLVNGVFDVYSQASLVIAVVGLAAGAIMDPERVQTWLTGRQARYGGNALIMILAFLGIVVVLNILGQEYSKRVDLTEDKDFTLATESVEILKKLEGPVTVTGYFSDRLAGQKDSAEGLLEQYRHNSDGKLTYRFVDPFVELTQAEAASITQDGELVLESAGRREHVTALTELDISSALIKLSNPVSATVYFLTGQGERSLQEPGESGLGEAKAGLERLNYTVGTLSPLIAETIPADATVVIIAAPSQPLEQEAVTALDEYLKSGGGLIYLTEPRVVVEGEPTPEDPLLEYLNTTWGIGVQDDLVLDSESTSLAIPVVDPEQQHGLYGASPITEQLSGLATFFPSARSLTTRTVEDRFISPVRLVESAEAPLAWGETDLAGLATTQPTFDEEADHAGPVALAASAEDAASSARVVVFGDVDFASNGFIQNVGNGDLFYDAVNWAAGQADLLTLPPRDQTNRLIVPPSATTANLILLLTVFVMPLAVLVSGGVVWYQRRKHS